GPTPISALIHAATMVTAGIFMVARMSPLYELSSTALSVVLVIGGTTAFFMGLVGVVQNDIKRVIAYSTLSQLGYMFVGLGASAYAAGIFHLMTHAFFKALLFLGAGSVIIAMHHEQDMRKMGGLRKYMPITYWTMVVGSLALIGFPGFAGFFSKDSIIEAVHHAQRAGSGYAYLCVLLGVFVTALYTFRLLFMVFHGKERMDEHTKAHLHETPAVVTVPLIMLAIPSLLIGGLVIRSVLYGHYFGSSLYVAPGNNVLGEMAGEFHGPFTMFLEGLISVPFWLSMLGVATAWFFYLKRPDLLPQVKQRLNVLYEILVRKFGFDELFINVFAASGRALGTLFWRVGDAGIIDGIIINGTARTIGRFATVVRRVQSGYLYHYAFAMIIGLLLLLTWFVMRWHGVGL
ncbi:MAG TPA: NADH-quinone oxidoreductase subunit L, partial [Pseudomonadales bacterium]|nr:NADH-quinone oxidoreductase subunit L [Pseudomonadales bacterium]